MPDFDVIETFEDLENIPTTEVLSPDPIVIKGNGNITLFGLSSRFDSVFPPKLVGKVAPEEFNATICRINRVLQKSISVNVRWLLFGCICCCCTLSCSLWPVVCLSRRTIRTIEKLLDWENAHLYYKLGLQWKLHRTKCESNNMTEYVLWIDFLPKQFLLHPD
ncbi:Cysteine-rich hydrophobic domain 2 protein [Trichinella nativa]|uniref:Cysteine-rich hydrophobic domain 2 protein n=3 Tax=Trichinella TaxID=6333 RepID=A0A0V1LTS2_9BILA|nr:Cysteine-rich hydrophobic domain 2 protein [Trichinella murrelli]KRX57155.1 Cysteine-rich hydrophobic domain 2 protein [Trichinella sp. T9]KRY47871.1 Cysteine-rich hydrophobic domain 2 protein [Trichinella britovi]KRZ62901.1 Cysteine-rich hydrophobic domain 2 protein [Trichinella nativa]